MIFFLFLRLFFASSSSSHSFLMTNDFEVDVHAQKDTNKYATGDQTLSRIRNEIQASLWAANTFMGYTESLEFRSQPYSNIICIH